MNESNWYAALLYIDFPDVLVLLCFPGFTISEKIAFSFIKSVAVIKWVILISLKQTVKILSNSYFIPSKCHFIFFIGILLV